MARSIARLGGSGGRIAIGPANFRAGLSHVSRAGSLTRTRHQQQRRVGFLESGPIFRHASILDQQGCRRSRCRETAADISTRRTLASVVYAPARVGESRVGRRPTPTVGTARMVQSARGANQGLLATGSVRPI